MASKYGIFNVSSIWDTFEYPYKESVSIVKLANEFREELKSVCVSEDILELEGDDNGNV